MWMCLAGQANKLAQKCPFHPKELATTEEIACCRQQNEKHLPVQLALCQESNRQWIAEIEQNDKKLAANRDNESSNR